ncbi:MAG: hypothetical protein QOI95_711 [Acidimicrobiaceae bacterium]|jgi:hypothetical protein
MAVPGEAVKLVQRWCEERDRPEFRDRARLEATASGNTLTIFECTRMPDEAEWLRVPSAQFRYDPRTQVWALYWADRDSKWHIVQVTPTFEIEELLDEVEADPHCLFFG